MAATASYLEAKTRGGQWLVRIEDLDLPRVVPGAAGQILRGLESLGFEWDEAVLYQSTRTQAYRAEFEKLERQGLIYPCGCSRKEIADSVVNRRQTGELRYPGTCRQGLAPGRLPRSWRVRVSGDILSFTDAIQGLFDEDLAQTTGDFVVLRADGYYSYQLAVVVDDAEQNITHVVRGADLLDSTARQLHLQRWLGYAHPSYAHLPVATDQLGDKLSKRTQAPPLATARPSELIRRVLQFLHQDVPEGLGRSTPEDLWKWALSHWDLGRVPAVRASVPAAMVEGRQASLSADPPG